MKKVFTAILSLVICWVTFSAFAQQDAQFSQYMFNTLYFNPAYAGSEGFTRFQLVYRNQWTGYSSSFSEDGSGNPTTINFSLNTPIARIRGGAGLHIVRDQIGPITDLDAQASFAYHFPLKNGKLSLGVRLGIYNETLDPSKYRAVDDNDPLIVALRTNGRQSQSRPDFAFGVYYRTEKYYMGASVNHLIKSDFNYGLPNLQNALNNHANFTAGYNLDLNYEWVFTPSILLKTDLNTYSFDLDGLFTYNQNFWVGGGFRQGDSGIVLLGANMVKDKQGNNSMRIGYSMDVTIKGQAAKKPLSHEIMLSYRLPSMPPVARQITRTPRFRH